MSIVGPRPIVADDFELGYFELLALLTVAPKPSRAEFEDRLALMRAHGIETLVLIDDKPSAEPGSRVIGSVSIIVEPKFIRGLSFVAHIEDVVVHPDYQGKGLGAKLIESACAFAKSRGCYKAILDADDKNSGFYQKCGFYRKEAQFRKDF